MGSAADLADPDGDGVVNLLGYSLAGDPLVATPAGSLFQTALAAPRERLAVTFVRRRADLVYTVQATSALQGWQDLETASGPVGASVMVVDVIAPAPARFLRLRVTTAPSE